ncbi:coiled-coil domain-containing protein 160-like [Echinops telfairi]|uniref:Coiled-coil domain-containing protein 160-like n=1 Tax=Echinops telfairi TaxID=9371 RepID=A0ABM0ICM6_ECHTE|nr:coiled-coil domain-containing protein 160-like [Echinops telfairi]
MDAVKNHKETEQTSSYAALDCPAQASQPASATPAIVDKTKKMGETYHLSSQKFCQENKGKKKVSFPHLYEKEREPKLRERKINIPKGTRAASSASCEICLLAVCTQDRCQTTDSRAPSTKESPSGRCHHRRGDPRQKPVGKTSLKVRPTLLKAELEELDKKYKKIEEEFENAERELLNAEQEAPKKHLNFLDTRAATSKKDFELKALRNDLFRKATTVKSLTKELRQAQDVIHKLHQENHNLKEMVKNLKQRTEAGSALLQEELKLFYEFEIEKVRGELNAIKSELKIEKTLQARNNWALELLRTHFTSERPTSALGPNSGNTSSNPTK